MIWSLAIANIVGAGLCFLLARHLAKITMIPFVWIVPFLIVAISFATLQVNRDPRDLLLVLVFGAVGVFMRRFGFSRPAFLIGFVLQGNLERSFYQTSQLYDLWGFISRPIVLLLAVVVATVLINSLRKQLSTTVRFDTPEHEASLMATRPLQLLMPVMLAAVFGGALWILKDLQPLGRTFPEIVAGIGLVAALIAAAQILRKVPSSMEDQEQEGTEYPVSMLRVGGWLAAAMALLIAFGFFAGSALFLALFLGIEARARIWQIAAGIIGIVGLYLVLMFYSGTFLPDGWVLSLNPWTYF
jgi:putative tricarboxylic transport membrane protein